MSIREINDKFIGLRVQRNVNKITHQKHFSFRIPVIKDGVTRWRNATRVEKKAIYADALAYDQKLLRLQNKTKIDKIYNPFDGRTNTGIKGISFRSAVDSQGYTYWGFFINTTNYGKQYSGCIRLADRTWRQNWKLAVLRLAEIKKLDHSMLRKLINLVPPEKKLLKLMSQ